MLAQRPRTDRAFERLYRHHVTHVYRYALAVLRSPEDAEDVTQATFLNAYRAYDQDECPRSPGNWLIAICHGFCEQRARQEARFDEVGYEDQAEQAVPEDEGPSANDVRRALARLPFEQRAALIMREVEERSCAEIAVILGLSLAAIESLLFRARRTLREELEGALTCPEAERAVSRHLDGLLGRGERRELRQHIRDCGQCETFASGQRVQRAALRALANVALPPSLASFFDPPEQASLSSA